MRSRNTAAYWFMGIALAGVVLGTYAYLALWMPYSIQSRADAAQNLAAAMTTLETTSSTLIYGTVVAIDAQARTLTIDAQSPFDAGTVMRLTFEVPNPAYIAQQSLIVQNGIASSLSERIAGSLDEIHPGDRVAVMNYKGKDARLNAAYILFGNPL